MADCSWVTFEVWPWDDAWLAIDAELADAFKITGLIEHDVGAGGYVLVSAMNGDREDTMGDEVAPPRTIVTGEMRGGSYEIREETSVLEALRDRGIAYRLQADPKWEWDGDESFWHPGMKDERVCGWSGEERHLPESEFRSMVVASGPPEARLAVIDAAIDSCRKAAGSEYPGLWGEALRLHLLDRGRLIANWGTPVPTLAELVTAYFDGNPYAWRPDPDYKPKLKKQEVTA